MKRVHFAIAALLLVSLTAPVFAQDEEAFLPPAWDEFKATATDTPAGGLYVGYVLGVLQGTNENSLTLRHVPEDISIGQMLQLVGEYIDKHRAEASFKQLSSEEIVIKAVLAKYPAPQPTEHNL